MCESALRLLETHEEVKMQHLNIQAETESTLTLFTTWTSATV